MIKPASLVKEYTLVWSGDPALALPDSKEERDKALELARETGVWDSLIKPGEKPTLFQVRPLSGRLLDHWIKRCQNLTRAQSFALAVRLCLRSVVNWGEHRVRHMDDPEDLEIQMTTPDIIDALYAVGGVGDTEQSIGRSIVEELGILMVTRGAIALSPKS